MSLGEEQNSEAVKLVLGFLVLVSQDGYIFREKVYSAIMGVERKNNSFLISLLSYFNSVFGMGVEGVVHAPPVSLSNTLTSLRSRLRSPL